MSDKKPIIVRDAEMPTDIIRQDIDLSYLSGGKDLRSVKVLRDGLEFWMAQHHSTGIYWTTNPRDPKILNTVHNPPRPRGRVEWYSSGGNPNGKPKGSKNSISAKQACEKLGIHPAEFLAAVVSGSNGHLKQYRIKDPSSITMGQKIKCAELLLSRMSPTLKSVDVGTDGEPVTNLPSQEDEQKQRVMVYLPEKGSHVEIETSKEEADQLATLGYDTYMRQHEQEYTAYDKSDEDDSYTWKDQE